MPLERGEALLEAAQKHDLIIIEDDYESESSFDEQPIPALKSLDRNNRVIYIGSLSKSLAPGLRVGYIVAPPELIKELRALRRQVVPARAAPLRAQAGHQATLRPRRQARCNGAGVTFWKVNGHGIGIMRRPQHADAGDCSGIGTAPLSCGTKPGSAEAPEQVSR